MPRLLFDFYDDIIPETLGKRGKKIEKPKVIVGHLKFIYPYTENNIVHDSTMIINTFALQRDKFVRISLGAGVNNNQLYRACIVLDFKVIDFVKMELLPDKTNKIVCYLSAISSFNPQKEENMILFEKPCMTPVPPPQLKFTKSWIGLSIDFARRSGCDILELDDGAVIRVKKDDGTYTLGSLSMRTLLDSGVTFYEKYGFKFYKEYESLKVAKSLHLKTLSDLLNDSQEDNTYKNKLRGFQLDLNPNSTIQYVYKKMLLSNKNNGKVTDWDIHQFVGFVFERLNPSYIDDENKTHLFIDLNYQIPVFDGFNTCSIRSFHKELESSPLYTSLSNYEFKSEDVVYGEIQ